MSEKPEKTGEEQEIIRDEKGRFIEGVSGNPAGKPKGRFSITSLMIKELESSPEKTKEIITWLLANRKDLIWNKIDPNPPTDLNLGVNPELPFIIKIIKYDGTEGENS